MSRVSLPAERRIDALAYGALLLLWLAFLAAPFASFAGARDGIFVPSQAWSDHEPIAIVEGTAIGITALCAMMLLTAIGIFLPIGTRVPRRAMQQVLAWTWVFLMLFMPLWGWGFERGFLRVWAHQAAPTLAQVATSAIVTSSYVTRHRNHESLTTHFVIPLFGRLTVQVDPNFTGAFRTYKGDQLQILGERTWVGTYYHQVDWTYVVRGTEAPR